MRVYNRRSSFNIKYNQNIATTVFLAIQIIYFIFLEWQGGSTNSAVLLTYGAKVNPLITVGEYWRLITPIFIHIGFMHLVINSLSLYYLGDMIERLIGTVRFSILYLLSGLMGNLISFGFSPSLSAGASTSIFGLFSFMVVLGYLFPYNNYLAQTGQSFKVLIGLNIIFGFFSGGVDNFGHIGGIIGGVLIGLLLATPKNYPRRFLIMLSVTLIFILISIYAFYRGQIITINQYGI
ncbi:rhomboid family intramembrane serine protease [Atopobacter phocae]|uniref:rhomboid family intramembrane serine protease n=1 Tax=Atopobacter phocae TaxID=136492 RepID=UPI0004AE7885|nr:rhomboid family intramembrane serine protease [Atopobacter phocae]